ncbi:Zn-dependent M28 family amino/carboxypeptidase [Saccharothrix ecbatanensis]|uniref:Zn-dependent M28 family amino/carboxypeptidase n=1 Tax=Saccharothrix ecbatanensis TaxID=1105145 RepID=A0A7W9HS13_9PSEU|nr:M28 family metallopeptidase [Saccharothrix ecbatanensis]MBB5806978.1 Zn-dependent M28 family amino/carboxypeptidase [Saccharothrix ecbatanensis]
MSGRTGVRRATILAASASLALAVVPAANVASAAPLDGPKLAQNLTKKVTLEGVNRHLIAFQRIADRNDGNRAAGTSGYDASVEYVAGKLRAAGFDVSTPTFMYPVQITDAATAKVGATTYENIPLEFSPQTPVGGVTGPLRVVPEDGTPGCEAEDFAGQDFTGSVALIRRGACTFDIKHRNAAAAGAIAVIIANNTEGPLSGVTLGAPGVVPTGGVTRADGTALAQLGGQPATVDLRYHTEERPSRNVIAQTRTGRTDNVVMAGAHLDSVENGAGINDNGTGSAGLLESALQLGAAPKVNNAVRFAWWGAEELGLVGSEKYVQGLTFEQQLDIALYLNFDMIGSPNAAYFVYDGDNSDGDGAGAGPYGSAQIEQAFVDYLTTQKGVQTEGTDFSGRSDYGEFILNGIPAGGLFTGAEGVKTEAQATKWGGTAGTAYDPNYHGPGDNLGNIDRTALDRNSDALAWVTASYAISTESVNGVPSRTQRAEARAASKRSLHVEQHDHSHADVA